jgi:hypothetical protein
MSPWFRQSLGDPLTAGEPMARIEELFRAAFARAGGPGDMAVFVRPESEGRLHCDVRAYFSPASAEVARAVQADPCAQPAPDGLSLLAGAHEAWRALFPERPGGRAS